MLNKLSMAHVEKLASADFVEVHAETKEIYTEGKNAENLRLESDRGEP